MRTAFPDGRRLVKLCGLSEPVTLRAALDAGADMVGLVFFPKSPRHVSFETARDLAAIVRAESDAAVVALTVDADDDLLDAIDAAVRPDVHQLHGAESAARVREAMRRAAVMKALPVRKPADVESAAVHAEADARILFDAPPPPDVDVPGGNGHGFDWTTLTGAPAPFMLSGGLTPDNAAAAMRVPGAFGVDVSSGIERARGVKDAGLIRAFVEAARAACEA